MYRCISGSVPDSKLDDCKTTKNLSQHRSSLPNRENGRREQNLTEMERKKRFRNGSRKKMCTIFTFDMAWARTLMLGVECAFGGNVVHKT